MSGGIQLWLTDDKGMQIDSLSTALGVTATRELGKVGWLTYNAPLSFDERILKPDYQIQVWLTAEDTTLLGLWRTYFLRQWTYSTRGSNDLLTLSFPDSNSLLSRRVIAAYAMTEDDAGGYSPTEMLSLEADLMMKNVVNDSQDDSIDPVPDYGSRAWSQFSVEADTTDGPVISLSFPNFDVPLMSLSGDGIIPTIGRASKQAGQEVFYDVKPKIVDPGKRVDYEFVTSISPGPDVSDAIVFSTEGGNLIDPELEIDYRDVINYVYAHGKGSNEDETIEQAWDADSINQSIWGRIEGGIDGSNQDDDGSLVSTANSKLQDSKAKIRFRAGIMDTEATQFGRDWDIGYIVRAQYRLRQFKSLVRAATVTLDQKGNRKVSARVEYQSG